MRSFTAFLLLGTLLLSYSDLFGQITNWPKRFMGDAFGEAYAAEKARLKRMKADAAE